MRPLILLVVLLTISTERSSAQQLPDTTDFFTIEVPRFAEGEGPTVCIDAGHNNFHTLNGRYRAFANILEADGYGVVSRTGALSPATFAGCDVYVISNALHESNANSWPTPNPSAFSREEIAATREWIDGGGGLFLIADHMPFGGAAQELGQALGFAWLNVYANDGNRNFDFFTRAEKTLHSDPITEGLDSIVSFTGSAFALPPDGTPLLSFNDDFQVYFTNRPAVFSADVPRTSARGLHQLGYRSIGHGRVVASGEAAMFSAQLAGPNAYPMGLNNPAAANNIKLLRNLLFWLSK
ncbi:hypothetical protein [Lewinella sp. W8]|uniref:hypothetical protein n=1 Tax=Lewinella sp. W8 TaxID=2528208 RepID=UPI001068C10B|nr:hypothetical protein [Lewinella sp. W8]MTB52965.1 hypothetical protein [Lewinella sp. W8]